ncbi:MAG TPA: DUF4382 domain-containing protein [Gammaproteobacteria bacterium]
MKHIRILLALGLSALAGCNGESGSGRIGIDLTDAPADGASSVVVAFTGVRVKPAGAAAIQYIFPRSVQVDLAELQGGASAPLLHNLTLPAGHYEWLELEVSATPGAKDSYVVDANGKHGLVLASGTGLRIAGGFDVKADESSPFIVDFDARRSVLPPASASSDFRLSPVLRMLDERAAGNIVGSVLPSLAAAAGCVPVVYVYRGDVAAPAGLDSSGSAPQPVTEAPVKLETRFGTYRFTAAYLPAGFYTLAFTCDAGNDDPSLADAVSFDSVGTVQAIAGNTILTALH